MDSLWYKGKHYIKSGYLFLSFLIGVAVGLAVVAFLISVV